MNASDQRGRLRSSSFNFTKLRRVTRLSIKEGRHYLAYLFLSGRVLDNSDACSPGRMIYTTAHNVSHPSMSLPIA